ncbi:hypothetical protein E4V51_01915 [Paenibacillus sp. 28ISP30-2]|nr:hypothetical protein [Paenibacillus sp. 28ISP30-2]
MRKTQSLANQKARLQYVMRMMDSEPSFESKEGRSYIQTLVKLVLIEMQIEALDKKRSRP